jgi:hypothetical protein
MSGLENLLKTFQENAEENYRTDNWFRKPSHGKAQMLEDGNPQRIETHLCLAMCCLASSAIFPAKCCPASAAPLETREEGPMRFPMRFPTAEFLIFEGVFATGGAVYQH